MDNILINEEELNKIISSLDQKIKNIETIYKDLDDKLKNIDGSNDVWVGDAQKSAYDKYLNISKGYENSINKIKSLKVFLENTLNNYLNSDKKLNETIDKNQDNLEIN